MVHMSQSAISKKIISLENELGIRLIEREGRHHMLTYEGRRLLSNFIGIMENYDNAMLILEEIKREKNKGQRDMRILCVPAVARFNIISMIESFSLQKEFLNINIDIEEMETDRIMLMLRYSDCDLVFVPDIHLDHDEYGTRLVSREQFMIAVSNDHPLAKKDIITLRDLQDVPLILNRPESMLYFPCVEACESAGFVPEIATTTARPTIAFQYLHSNKQYAYMGLRRTLLGEKSDLHIAIPIEDSPECDFVFAWRKKIGLSKNATALLNYIDSTTE